MAYVRVGDVVLVKDDLHPPSQWSIDLIEKVFPNEDGTIRKKEVRFKNSTEWRSVSSLGPINPEESIVTSDSSAGE